MTTTFDSAFAYTVFTWEGGAKLTNYATDPGGMTKYGICAKYHPNVDIANLNEQGAKAIYRRDYWDAHNLDQLLNPIVAIKLFDALVNPGTASIRLAQNALNRSGVPTVADGHLGPKTLAALNTVNPTGWAQAMCSELAAWYNTRPEGPNKSTNLRGWLRRANSLPVIA